MFEGAKRWVQGVRAAAHGRAGMLAPTEAAGGQGSTLGRRASASDKAKGPRAILKDMDLLDGNYKMSLGKARKKAFLDQIRSDCHLLMSLKIMDYSLLLGIHYRDDASGPAPQPHSSQTNVSQTPVTPPVHDGWDGNLRCCLRALSHVLPARPAAPARCALVSVNEPG